MAHVGFEGRKGFTSLEEAHHAGGVKCPHCGHGPDGIQKFGYAGNGRQRYRCRDCGKTFCATTESFLAHTKKDASLWQEYLQYMVRGMSISQAATACGISPSTAFKWRHKILDAIRRASDEAEPMEVADVADAGKIHLPLSFKGRRPADFAYPGGRKPRQRGQASRTTDPAAAEQVAVEYARVPGGTRSRARVTGLGNPAVTGSESPQDGRLKEFLKPFHGVATKYLDNYLEWNAIMGEREAGNDEEANAEAAWRRALRGRGRTLDVDVHGRPEVPPVCAKALARMRPGTAGTAEGAAESEVGEEKSPGDVNRPGDTSKPRS
jgi:transposase-like protein